MTDAERLRVRQQTASVRNLKGVLLKMLGRTTEAAEFYRSALEINDRDDAAWENLGVVHALGRDLAGAEADFRRACDLVGLDKTKLCHTPWRSLASLLMFRGDTEAGAVIESALTCRSDDSWTTLIRARMRLTSETYGDPAGALMDVDFASRDASNRSIPFRRLVLRTMATAYLRNDRFGDAARFAKKAIAAGDMATFNLLTLSAAEARQGRAAEARQAFERAEEQWPADLKRSGDYHPSAPEGVLWFETADELLALRAQAAAMLTDKP